MYFVIEIGTLIKRFRLANKLAFYLTTIFLYIVHHSIPKVKLDISVNYLVFSIHLHRDQRHSL